MTTANPVVLVTIDTEEDDWGEYSLRNPAVTNVSRLESFQELCDSYGAVPTYLCNWPVLSCEVSARVLQGLARDADCEVGVHIHPWNTPPVEERIGPRSSMLCNLPPRLISKKMTALRDLSVSRFGSAPKVFRAGRWAFGAAVADVLVELGYEIDTSVSPFVDWSDEMGPDYREAPRQPYRFDPRAPLRPSEGGVLLEVPASVGFLGGRPEIRKRLRGFAERPVLRRLRMVGIMDRLGIAKRRWLSPELASGKEMVELARSLVASGERVLNFTFHSPTLVPGLTPFTPTRSALEGFTSRIETFFEFARESGYEFASVGAVPALLGADEPLPE